MTGICIYLLIGVAALWWLWRDATRRAEAWKAEALRFSERYVELDYYFRHHAPMAWAVRQASGGTTQPIGDGAEYLKRWAGESQPATTAGEGRGE